MSLLDSFRNIQNEGFDLFKKKNKDYGNAFADYGTIGILVRMNDKIRRYISVSNNSINMVNTESLRDTLVDLQNYATLGIHLIDEEAKKNKYITSTRDYNYNETPNKTE